MVSDLHIGSKLALCPPTVTLDEGGTHRANKGQLYLWRQWLNFWELVKTMKRGQDLYIAIVGEIRDGTRHTSQSVTTNEADIFKMCYSSLRPIIDLEPDYTFIFRGTEAHSGSASWFDELMADGLQDELNVQANPDTGQLSSWYLNIWIEDVLFDITHHGKTGNLPWTGAGAVERAAVELAYYYMERGERLPQVAIRGHKHTMYDSGDNAPIRMLTLPGWKFPDTYLHKVMPGKMPYFGGYIFQIEGKDYEVEKIKESPKRGRAWKKK